MGPLNQCQMPPVLSQFSNPLTPAGPAHGDRGAALHQLRNAGLPLRTDHQPGSEYIQHFPAPQMRTDLWGQTTGLSILDFVVSSNRKQTGDFQNFGTGK